MWRDLAPAERARRELAIELSRMTGYADLTAQAIVSGDYDAAITWAGEYRGYARMLARHRKQQRRDALHNMVLHAQSLGLYDMPETLLEGVSGVGR